MAVILFVMALVCLAIVSFLLGMGFQQLLKSKVRILLVTTNEDQP